MPGRVVVSFGCPLVVSLGRLVYWNSWRAALGSCPVSEDTTAVRASRAVPTAQTASLPASRAEVAQWGSCLFTYEQVP